MIAAPLPPDELRTFGRRRLRRQSVAVRSRAARSLAPRQRRSAAILFGLRAARRLSKMGVRQPGPGRWRRPAAGFRGQGAGVRVRGAGTWRPRGSIDTGTDIHHSAFGIHHSLPDPSPFIPPPSSLLLHPFLSGTMLSYVAAALMLGAGVLAARGWGLRGRTEVPEVAVASPGCAVLTGRRRRRQSGTALSRQDCATDRLRSGAVPKPSPVVVNGAASNIVSGRVEVTYRTGAKVVIEGTGPVHRRLAQRRLSSHRQNQGGLSSTRPSGTRALQSPPAERNREPPAGRSQPRTPGAAASWFTVHTPNATFAAWDAAFSVSGDASGECYATVDRGSVELTPLFDDLQRADLAARRPVRLDGTERPRRAHGAGRQGRHARYLCPPDA